MRTGWDRTELIPHGEQLTLFSEILQQYYYKWWNADTSVITKCDFFRNTETNSGFFLKLLSKYVYVGTDHVRTYKRLKEINKSDDFPKIYFILF